MIFGFLLDNMYLALLGVLSKLLKIWVVPFFINDQEKLRVNRRLRIIRRFLTNEFESSVPWDYLETWKAQEFRIFFLYNITL